MYTTRYAERKPGLNKSQGCWQCIILYYPLISMYNQKYKKPFWTIKDGPVSQSSFWNWFLGNLAPPVSTSLFLSPSPSLSFSGWIPFWSMEAHHVYLLALASKTHTRRSPRWGTLCPQVGAGSLTLMLQTSCLKVLLVFQVNQVIQTLCSIKFSYYTIFS